MKYPLLYHRSTALGSDARYSNYTIYTRPLLYVKIGVEWGELDIKRSLQ